MSYTNSFKRGLEPQILENLDDWSDKNIFLSSKSAAEPGRYRTQRTEYLREIMQNLSIKSIYQRLSVMKGVQLGFTNCACNLIGYIIHRCPSSTMYVQPTIEMAERFSKTRIKPLIELSPVLKERIKDPREKDSGNTLLSKEFEGGILILSGANSSASLCSTPVKYLILDEIDRMPDDVEGEGCPIELSIARTATFSRKKIFEISTPTLGSKSKINKSFKMGDQRKYFVPCPFCNTYQIIEIENLKWTTGDYTNVSLQCISCKELIPEYKKTFMIENGHWKPTAKNKDPLHISYHINSLYAPKGWYSWGQAAKLFEEAQNDRNKLKTLKNTVEGVPFEETGEIVDWERLYNRRENYERNIVPKGGLFITCGVDVQHSRLECELVVWGRNKESWSLDFRVFHGKVSEQEVWKNLDDLLNEEFEVVGTSAKLKIKKMGIDSSDGNTAFYVYDFCRNYKFDRVFPIQGSDKLDTYFTVTPPREFKQTGKRVIKGVRIFKLGVSSFKSELMGFLEKNREDQNIPYGYCHFPDYNEEYFMQLTSEVEINGKWQKIRARNEALDCRIYARGCASIFGIDRFNKHSWDKLENKLISFKSVELGNEDDSFTNDVINTTQNNLAPEKKVEKPKTATKKTLPSRGRREIHSYFQGWR